MWKSSGIGQTTFAAASEESRPVLTGIHADFNDTKLTLAAADGFRLAVSIGIEGANRAAYGNHRIGIIGVSRAARPTRQVNADVDRSPVHIGIVRRHDSALVKTRRVLQAVWF